MFNKNREDEMKNIAGRIPEATRSVKTLKTEIVAEVSNLLYQTTNSSPRSDPKIGET